MSRWADAVVGGWQTTFNLFAKSGTGFTPFWICDDCSPIEPGNIGISSLDAVGDFNAEPSFRPIRELCLPCGFLAPGAAGVTKKSIRR
jgi:hypothetical protein